jgi:transposase-like protein
MGTGCAADVPAGGKWHLDEVFIKINGWQTS